MTFTSSSVSFGSLLRRYVITVLVCWPNTWDTPFIYIFDTREMGLKPSSWFWVPRLGTKVIREVALVENRVFVQVFCPGSVWSRDKWPSHLVPKLAGGHGAFSRRPYHDPRQKGSEAFCGLLVSGGHKLIHGYSCEYPLYSARKNYMVFSVLSWTNLAVFLANNMYNKPFVPTTVVDRSGASLVRAPTLQLEVRFSGTTRLSLRLIFFCLNLNTHCTYPVPAHAARSPSTRYASGMFTHTLGVGLGE
jgi:hypothetical protein